jgi:hypothetical protein
MLRCCRLYYKAHGPGTELNFELPKDRRAQLDRMMLEQLTDSYRKAVKAKMTSMYRGVSRSVSKSKWEACIGHHCKKFHLGYFEDEREAALAYDEAARELHGA